MKFTLALLALLAVVVHGTVLRSRQSQSSQSKPKNRIEEEWTAAFPGISDPIIQERVFKDGSEYVYLYDSQILTGMPDIHYQFSGARIRAVVRIQLGEKDVMQIEKVFVGSLHERFVSEPQSLVELSAFEPLSEQDAPFQEVLSKPVRFSYENGKINDFEITEDDPAWSVNIKRAILSTFQMSLTDREEPKSRDSSPRDDESNLVKSKGKSGARPGPSSDEDDSEYFTVVEDGIAGRCEVSYLVMEIPNEPESIYPMYDTENGTDSGSDQPRTGKPTNRRPSKPPGQWRKPRQAGDESSVLNVTKTFDYRNCEYRPFLFAGLHTSTACPGCESDPETYFDLLESAAHTRYNITGNKQLYLIDSAITEAVYKFTPRSHYAGSTVAYANITVTLMESGPLKAPIQFPDQKPTQIDGLHMIFPAAIKRRGNKIYYESPEASSPMLQKPEYWPNVEEKAKKIRALFEKLVQGMEQKEVESETAVLVEMIVRLMKYAYDDELEQIHQAVKSVSAPGMQKEELEHLFADLLVATGTNCTFTYIKKLLVNKQLEGPVVQDVLTLLPFKMQLQKVGPEMIESWMDMCESEAIGEDPFVHRACWLSFGTLVHKVCSHKTFDARVAWNASKPSENEENGGGSGKGGNGVSWRRSTRALKPNKPMNGETDEPENLRCPPEVRQKVIEKAISTLKNPESDEHKILAIKVMGNMGLNETTDELAEIIKDPSTPVYIRTQAIYSLKYIATDYPEMVLDILLPLYRQSKNPTQIRIAAFIILLAGRPNLPVLEDIAQSLNREVDMEVAGYVYSSMTSMANNTDPCLRNLTRDLRLALQLTTPINTDWRHSKSFHVGQYDWQMKRGIFLESNYIMDKEAPVPRAGNLRLHTTFWDKSFDLFEVGYETEGFGDTLRKYVRNLTSDSLDEVLSGKASRRPRQAGPPSDAPELEQIMQMLKLTPKDPKEMRGTAYVKIFGQQTRFAVLNPQTISRFILELISQSRNMIPRLTGEGLPLDQRRATMLMDTKLQFPTVMGVPIQNSVRIPIVAGVKGKVRINMEPKPAEGFSFFKQTPEKLLVESEVKTTIAAEIHSKLTVYLGFLKIGTGVRARMSFNLPTSGKLEFNLMDKMTKVTMDLPENPVKLVKVDSYPLTLVNRLSRNTIPYQPKNVPAGSGSRLRFGDDSADSSEEITPQSSKSPRPTPTYNPLSGEKVADLNITDVPTEMITHTGHAAFPQWTGIPYPVPDMWEIATPLFVKSRLSHLQIGHESTSFKVDIKSETEYPDSRIPTRFLPYFGAKCQMEVKFTPKQGAKKVVITAFERSEFSTKPEKELLNKLKDKMPDIPVKDLERPNTIKDMDKFPKQGYSLQVLVNAEGNGSADAWTTRGLLALIYTADKRYSKFIVGMNSKTPVLPKKFCLAGEVRNPERNGMWWITPEQPLNKSIQGNVDVSWGDECGADKYLKIRARLQKTKEQLEVERNDLYDVNGIPVPPVVADELQEGDGLFKSLYQQCKKDREVGAFFSKECVDFAIRYTDLLRMKIDIDYRNVSRPLRGMLHKLERLATGQWFYWNTEVQDVDVKNPEHRINAVVEFSADRNTMDIKYQTPRANTSMINLDLPYDVMPVGALVPWNYARIFGMTSPVSCTISGPKIDTFDDVSDEMPLSQCWHLMAKDVSDENMWAVLVANVGKDPKSMTKKIAVIFQGHRIEIVPTGSAPSTPQNPITLKSYTVKYNGQPLKDALTPEKRTTIPPNVPEDKQELADIVVIMPESSGNKEPIVALMSRVTGLQVLFDGSSVTVMPSPFWKNSLVGLCGIYNGQPWDDKLLPNRTMAETPEEVSAAFQLPTGGCDPEIQTLDGPTPMKKQSAGPSSRKN